MTPIIDSSASYSVDFATRSNKFYVMMVYCYSTSTHFYALPEAEIFTAPDNGGKIL